jgi:signal peptidase
MAQLSKGRKIYKIISAVIITVIAVFLSAIAILAIIQRSTDKSPNLFGYYIFTVLTDSMEPELVPGDVILSKSAKQTGVKLGDIVTYKSESVGGYFLTHRVIGFNIVGGVEYVITRGDNTAGNDPPVPVDRITSVMVKKLDFISKMLGVLKTPQGFFLIIVAPLVLVLILIFVSYYRDKLKLEKREIKEKAQSDAPEGKTPFPRDLSQDELNSLIESLKNKDDEKGGD